MGVFSKKEEHSDTRDIITEILASQESETLSLIKRQIEYSFNEATASQASILKAGKDLSQLQIELREAKDALASVRKDYELEKQEMEHLISLKNERMAVELERKGLALEKEFHTKEMELTKVHFDKIVETINSGQKGLEKVYTQILTVLPNVNLDISQEKV